MTNLIITSSFVVGFYSSALFLVFQVPVKGWEGNFSFKSKNKNWFSKRKNTIDRFPQFLLLTLLFHVCRPIILTIKNFLTKQNKLTLTLAQLFQVNNIAIFLHHKYLLPILVDYSNYLLSF